MRAEEGRNLERRSWFSHRDSGRLAGPSTDTRCSKLWGRWWTGLCVFEVLGARVEGDVWAVRESGRIGVGMVVEAVRVSCRGGLLYAPGKGSRAVSLGR